MRIVVTVSNWKRTGPVEPGLDLAAALQGAGHDVEAWVGRAPRGRANGAREAAALRQVAAPSKGLFLGKHRLPVRDGWDVRRLRRHLRRVTPDLVVTTLANDHRLVARALRSRRVPAMPLVRQWFRAPERPVDAAEVRDLRQADVVLVPTTSQARRLREVGLEATRLLTAGPALDLAALRGAVEDPVATRAAWGVPAEAICVGIVARMQRHRRFELLWEALEALRDESPRIHVVVVGRGTYAEQVGHEPVRVRGLWEHVTFAGYLRGAAYATALAAFDAQLLLVPGSDPTCRALREGMALGVPSVATRRGLLPEIVDEGATGWLVEDHAASLAEALRHLARDADARAARGQAARSRAEATYDAGAVADRLLAAVSSSGRRGEGA